MGWGPILKYEFQSVHFFCRECSYLGVEGWVSSNPLFEFINPYELLDTP